MKKHERMNHPKRGDLQPSQNIQGFRSPPCLGYGIEKTLWSRRFVFSFPMFVLSNHTLGTLGYFFALQVRQIVCSNWAGGQVYSLMAAWDAKLPTRFVGLPVYALNPVLLEGVLKKLYKNTILPSLATKHKGLGGIVFASTAPSLARMHILE